MRSIISSEAICSTSPQVSTPWRGSIYPKRHSHPPRTCRRAPARKYDGSADGHYKRLSAWQNHRSAYNKWQAHGNIEQCLRCASWAKRSTESSPQCCMNLFGQFEQKGISRMAVKPVDADDIITSTTVLPKVFQKPVVGDRHLPFKVVCHQVYDTPVLRILVIRLQAPEHDHLCPSSRFPLRSLTGPK